jgi:hypothetical protein
VTFKQYLSARKAGNDAAGDFVRLARADLTMPDVTTRDELKSYMGSRRDSYDAMEAGDLVWKEFQVAVRKQKA